MSNTLPWRTLAMPPTPRDFSAPSMALPWGSRMPDFRVTVTRAFMFTLVIPDEPRSGSIRNLVAMISGFRVRGLRPRPGMTSALHQHRAGSRGALVLHQDAQAFCHLGVGLEQPAEIAPKPVLVEFFVRLDVPQPAGVRGNLVGDDDAHHVVLEQPAAFHLEINQPDADAEKQPGEEIVDADGQRHDVVDLLRRGPAERGDVLFGNHRVVELVVLVIELDDRARQLGALLDAEPLRQGAGGDVAHHHFERHDLDLADQLLAHVEAADEVGGHPDVVEVLEQVLRDTVVEDALALDDLVLLGVERGGVVLEMLDQGSRLRSFIEDLGLAFINAAPTAHWDVPCVVEIHEIGVLLMTDSFPAELPRRPE